MMNLENEQEPSSTPEIAKTQAGGELPECAGPAHAVLGMVLVVAGMAILIASLILRDGNLTGRMPTIPYAGLLARILGTAVMIGGMALLGKGGMIKFGCVLLVGGFISYLGNVIINHEFGGAANGLGGLAVLLGIILLAVANGWLGNE
jgi:hypothetical protein